MIASTTPAPAAENAIVDTVDIVRAESTSFHVEGGHMPFMQPFSALLFELMAMSPVTDPVPMPATASPIPPHRSHMAAGLAEPLGGVRVSTV
jgi:hypothetical protein